MRRKHIVLVGMMGCGKSVVSRSLGLFLGRKAVDTDEFVAASAGMTISEIFKKEGEEKFRERELSSIEELVLEPETLVIATGGGAFCQNATRRVLLSAGVVVYLKADILTLAARVGTGKGRPLLEGNFNVHEKLQRMLQERRFFYETADMTVCVDRDLPHVIAEKLADHFIDWSQK